MSIAWIVRARMWAIVAGCAGFAALSVVSTAEAAPRGRARVAPGPIYVGAHPFLAPSAIYVAPYRVPPRAVVFVPSPWYVPPPVRVYREPLFYPNAIWGVAPQGPPTYGDPAGVSPGQPTPAYPPPAGPESVPAPPALPPPAEPPIEPGEGDSPLLPAPMTAPLR